MKLNEAQKERKTRQEAPENKSKLLPGAWRQLFSMYTPQQPQCAGKSKEK